MNPDLPMRNRRHLVLLSGPIFSSNMGCNALTYGALAILDDVAGRLGLEFDYSLLDNPVDGAVPPELADRSVALVDQVPDFGSKSLLRTLVRRDGAALRRRHRALRTADLFLDNGWGDSFSDIYGRPRFESVFRHYRYARALGKPLILLPQTIGPFRAPAVQARARAMLAYAAAVYARDPLSAACAQELIPGLDVRETIDLAMFMPYVPATPSGGGVRRIGVNPSGLLWQGGYTRANQFALKEDYRDLLRGVLRYLLATPGVQVELIGHDVRGPSAGNSFEDYHVCKLLQREFPACRVGPFFYGPMEAKSHISGLDVFIGSRMHACIAAYSSGVPVFPLGYSRKFTGLFAEKLGYGHGADLTEHGLAEVLGRLAACLAELPTIRAEFPARRARIETERAALVADLADRMAGPLEARSDA